MSAAKAIPKGTLRREGSASSSCKVTRMLACRGKTWMEYMLEEVKLLKIQIAAHEILREIGLAEEDLRSSYAAEPGLTRFWSWRVPMMKEKLRILHKEHELQSDAVRKMRETGDEKREEDREDREEMPPQQ